MVFPYSQVDSHYSNSNNDKDKDVKHVHACGERKHEYMSKAPLGCPLDQDSSFISYGN